MCTHVGTIVVAISRKWKLAGTIRVKYGPKGTLRHVGFEEHYSSSGRNNATITHVTVAHAPIKLTENLSEVHNAWTRCVGQLVCATYFFAGYITNHLSQSLVLVTGNEHTDMFIELGWKIRIKDCQSFENISDTPFDRSQFNNHLSLFKMHNVWNKSLASDNTKVQSETISFFALLIALMAKIKDPLKILLFLIFLFYFYYFSLFIVHICRIFIVSHTYY